MNLFHIIDHSFAQTANNENDRVWNVEISGNTTYEDIVIQRYIANERPRLIPRLLRAKRAGLEFSEDDVRRDAIRIQRFYSRRGFVTAEVSYSIEEGSRSWQKKIHFLRKKIPSSIHLRKMSQSVLAKSHILSKLMHILKE